MRTLGTFLLVGLLALIAYGHLKPAASEWYATGCTPLQSVAHAVLDGRPTLLEGCKV